MRFFAAIRSMAVNFVLPLALAWALVAGLHERYYQPSRITDFHGLVKLRLRLPGTSAGIEEPVLTVGKVGNATFIYIRLLKNAQAKVGIEFWGNSATESEAFPIPAQDADITLVTSFPALFLEQGDRHWRGVSEAEQRHLLSHFYIAVDGVNRLHGAIKYVQPPDPPYYLGSNPLGGSAVSDYFTGTVLSWSRR